MTIVRRRVMAPVFGQCAGCGVPRVPDAFVATLPGLATTTLPGVSAKVPVRAWVVARPGSVVVLADVRTLLHYDAVASPGWIVL